jgi:hypothetical protein
VSESGTAGAAEALGDAATGSVIHGAGAVLFAPPHPASTSGATTANATIRLLAMSYAPFSCSARISCPTSARRVVPSPTAPGTMIMHGLSVGVGVGLRAIVSGVVSERR